MSSSSSSSSSSNSPRHPRLAKLATDQLTRERVRQCERPVATTDDDDAAAINAIAQAIGANAARQRRRRLVVGSGGLAGALAAAAAVIIAVIAPPKTQTTTGTGTTAAAAASTALSASSITGGARALGVGVVILREGREVALVDQSAGSNSNSNGNDNGNSNLLTSGDRVLAGAHGKAALDLSTGTRVVLERGTDVSVTELGEVQRFMLRTGTMQADVAKLQAGQRFLVQTSDNTEIEVRGTSFRVEAVVGRAPRGDDGDDLGNPSARCADSTTRVFVTEGTVVVRSARGRGEDRVTAGGSWPPSCVAAATAAAAAAVTTTTAAVAMASPPTPTSFLGSPPPSSVSGAHPSAAALAPPLNVAASAPRAAVPPPSNRAASSSSSSSSSPSRSSSELAEQNRLYGEASALRRRGATHEAITAYERFLARYPSSQLAESAMVERMRLLALSGDRTQGSSTAAREYLARWPRGFARQEAIEIVQRTPP